MKKGLISVVIGLVLVALTIAIKISLRFRPDNWKIEFSELGSSSSPQAADLNGDNIKDIIIGAGAQEFLRTDKAVMAIDGKSGALLWKVAARNQVVGSPSLMDITGDSIPEVFIGGRSALLFCIDGQTGKVKWEFLPDHDSLDTVNDPTVLSFYNAQFVPDINNDNIPEMMVAYGGFIKARANDPNRPSGYLMILDPVTGRVLKKAAMPDNKETYMSPVVCDIDHNGELDIIYGSGGETLNGHFFRATFSDLLKEDLSKSIVLDSGQGKGFIAPPILADVTDDGVLDIIVNSVNGRMMCIDGKQNVKIWEVSVGRGFEIYTSPGPGNFSDDNVPDFFCSFGKGSWPDIRSTINIAVDGRNGQILYRDTIGTFQYASPVVMDVTQDGFDDILFALNIPAEQKVLVGSFTYLENRIVVFDIKNRTQFTFDNPKLGTNLGSTPLLTDLDDDAKVDVIYGYSTDATSSYSFKGMAIERIEIDAHPKLIRWMSYMNGQNFNSIWKADRKKD
jgi:outer membrane protein assembly factor BamB